MPRLTINLTEMQFEKIKAHADKKSMSLSYYSSSLLNIGLWVEQAATETNTHRSVQLI